MAPSYRVEAANKYTVSQMKETYIASCTCVTAFELIGIRVHRQITDYLSVSTPWSNLLYVCYNCSYLSSRYHV